MFPRWAVIAATIATLALSACASTSASTPIATGNCPEAPVAVVVSVDQWGDIAQQLGGACVMVTTIITNSSVNPHDYEPTAADIAKFGTAKLVVINGVDYDPWAARAIAATSPTPVTVDGGAVVGVSEGGNPHIWYNPAYVTDVADAITAELTKLAPSVAGFFTMQRKAFTESLAPYTEQIATIKAKSAGKTYVATEPVFDYMAAAVGLTLVSPQGYQNAAANDSDPAPGDIAAFQKLLTDKATNVMIFNTQTQGAIPEQLKASAVSAGIPVVNVTETVAPGAGSFVAWQVAQLKALAMALGV